MSKLQLITILPLINIYTFPWFWFSAIWKKKKSKKRRTG